MDIPSLKVEKLETVKHGHDLIFLDSPQEKLMTLQKKIQLNNSVESRFLFIIRASDVHMFQETFKTDNRITILDGSRIAQALMLNPKKVSSLFADFIMPAINTHLESAQKVFVYGEVVDILLENNAFDILIELENEWSKFISNKPIQLLCGYKYSNFINPIWRSKFKSVCDCHAHIENETKNLCAQDIIELKLSRINFDINSNNLKNNLNTEIKNSLALIQLASQSIDKMMNKLKISQEEKAQIKRHQGHIQTGIQRILDFLSKN